MPSILGNSWGENSLVALDFPPHNDRDSACLLSFK